MKPNELENHKWFGQLRKYLIYHKEEKGDFYPTPPTPPKTKWGKYYWIILAYDLV